MIVNGRPIEVRTLARSITWRCGAVRWSCPSSRTRRGRHRRGHARRAAELAKALERHQQTAEVRVAVAVIAPAVVHDDRLAVDRRADGGTEAEVVARRSESPALAERGAIDARRVEHRIERVGPHPAVHAVARHAARRTVVRLPASIGRRDDVHGGARQKARRPEREPDGAHRRARPRALGLARRPGSNDGPPRIPSCTALHRSARPACVPAPRTRSPRSHRSVPSGTLRLSILYRPRLVHAFWGRGAARTV